MTALQNIKRINYSAFEQGIIEDFNAMGSNELNINWQGLLTAFMSSGPVINSGGLQVSVVTGDQLRVSVGSGVSKLGKLLYNSDSAYDLLATNSEYDSTGGDGEPADITDNTRFLVEVQFVEKDGASENRNFVNPDGSTFNQATLKEKIVTIKSRIREGTGSTAPAADASWTKIAEIQKGVGSNYTIYNVDSAFGVADNTNWSADKKDTVLFKDNQTHRTQSTLDHPDESVTEEKLSAAVQAKLNASGSGGASRQVFTASGTWTRPSGVNYARVICVGGGGGGGNGSLTPSGGGGGGGGQITDVVIPVSSASYTVTIGSGGGAAAAGNNTTFGSLVTAKGGNPGVTGAANGGDGGDNDTFGGGLGATGAIGATPATTARHGAGGGGGSNNSAGNPSAGGDGFNATGGTAVAVPTTGDGGGGGGGYNGNGGNGASGAATAGNGSTYGAGGGGGSSTFTSGGNGAAGVCIVEWFE